MSDVTKMSADEVHRFAEESFPGITEPKAPEPEQKRVAIAILSYDASIYVRTMNSIMGSIIRMMSMGWGVTFIERDNDSMVARGRSVIASQFLETEECKNCTDLVMIDTDLTWNGDELIRLCAHPVDVVGGAYPYKDDSGDMPLRWPTDGLMEENGLWKVQAVTPGFLRMSRRILEKISREMSWLEFKDRGNKEGQRSWMFFDNKHRPSGIYDEGYIFCEHVRQVGGTVWLDPDLNLTHIGLKAYNHGTIRQWLEKKGETLEKLVSDFPGIPPLILQKAAMTTKNAEVAAEAVKAEVVASAA